MAINGNYYVIDGNSWVVSYPQSTHQPTKAFEHCSADPPRIPYGALPWVRVKALEGRAHQIFVDLDPRGHHGSQELAVLHLLRRRYLFWGPVKTW